MWSQSNEIQNADWNISPWVLFQQTQLNQRRTINDRKCAGMTTRGWGGGKAPKRHMNISIKSLFAVWNLWQALANSRNYPYLLERDFLGGVGKGSRKQRNETSVSPDCTAASSLCTLHCHLREKRPEEARGKVREKIKDCATCKSMHPWA